MVIPDKAEHYEPSQEFAQIFNTFDWNTLTAKEGSDLVKKFDTCCVSEALRHEPITTDFDISPNDCGITVSSDVVKHIFAKADKIILLGKVMPAPSMDVVTKMYSCCSTSESANYHVKIRNGQATCHCKMFGIHHLCSHSVASLHLNGTLFDHILWHRGKYKLQKAASAQVLTQAVDVSRVGLKQDQTRRRRSCNTIQETHLTPDERGPDQLAVCAIDHRTTARLRYVHNHPGNKSCYKRDTPIGLGNPRGMSIGEYVFNRSYVNRKTKQPSVSFKKQFAYCHLRCHDIEKSIHLCQYISQEVKMELQSCNIHF